MVAKTAANPCDKILTKDNVFANLRKIEYVRGPLNIRALELEKELQRGVKKPFNEIIKVNVGDAHAMGQQPITFVRQVLNLTVWPKLLDDPSYPEDAKERARTILKDCKGGSVGSYSESDGIEVIRKHVANYIQQRDGGIPSDYRNIILSNGASEIIKSFLKLFNEIIDEKPSGVLIPTPQYPLYTAILAEFGLAQIEYYLDEDNKWSLEVDELERVLEEAKGRCNPRVLVVINPGNPTGQVLTRANIENVIRFAHKNHLFLLADEVYQHNVYDKKYAFYSFKKVMTEMGEPYSKMELASFMSVSKGYMGECGIRGGYAEIINMDPDVMDVLMRSVSTMLCPNVLGQVGLFVLANPPQPNEPSYEEFQKEKKEVIQSLMERSRLIVHMLNSIPGYKTNSGLGSMFVFPRFDLPLKAIETARAKDQEPDLFYAIKLLENTGICIIPGSTFRQKPGTFIDKPFNEVIKVNSGDAHAMGQQPITFLRQVLTLTVLPNLLDDPSYPEDAKERARTVLNGCKGGSVGSYSESAGIEVIRKHVANYIQQRDGGIPCDYRDIILSNGASDIIKSFLKLFNEVIDEKPSGVLVPIPQYYLYSATLAEFGLAQIEYYLNEDNKWSLEVDELERALEEAKDTCNPRVLVVINPGNPTGHVLTRANIENVIRFAHKNHLFLLADEVYQHNVYDKKYAFHSFKKVMTEMGEPYSKMELASFMSVSKGYIAECGIRGGYSEIINMDPDVMDVLLNSVSTTLCPSVLGQVVLFVLANPPQPNEPSYKKFQKEKKEIIQSLTERSRLIVDMLNSIPGCKTNSGLGSMFVFPRFDLPLKAIETARAKDQEPDLFYAIKLLENTGICVIPGSRFGQKSGTYHFRTTILPQKEKLKTMLEALKQFHIKFLKEYS
ncbi:alanine aminotransferase 1-like [Nylanderia fulva]|uniref:alanine aminotransferase 1-like n=1 Tax=Nylanderia fulva TaxID=613905 RepID=UPI0010FB7A2F|nr:alanine aminotransferase 1-like [Nylanderia fulva]